MNRDPNQTQNKFESQKTKISFIWVFVTKETNDCQILTELKALIHLYTNNDIVFI